MKFNNQYELIEWAGRSLACGTSTTVNLNGRDIEIRMTERGRLTYFNGRRYIAI